MFVLELKPEQGPLEAYGERRWVARVRSGEREIASYVGDSCREVRAYLYALDDFLSFSVLASMRFEVSISIIKPNLPF